MKTLRRFKVFFFIAVSLLGAPYAIADVPSNSHQKKQLDAPEQNAVEAIVGQGGLPGASNEDGTSIANRILDGFEAGVGRAEVADGSVIIWGFKFQEANLQSLAIYDASKHLRLVAAVDDVMSLTIGDNPIASKDEYNRLLKKNVLSPVVRVFVDNEEDVNIYLPYLKRWLQASLLSFKANCERENMVDACRLAEKIQPPMSVYTLKQGALIRLQVPQLPAAVIPLRAFAQ